MNNNIYNIDLTRTLPPILKQDKTMQALSTVIAEELQETARMISNNVIYAKLDELPENLLDILAYDLHVDWYDYGYPIEVKRELVKTSIKVHRKMGTVYAVETVIRAVHQDSRIEEWFDYEGEPFHFKVIVNAGNSNVKIDMNDLIKKINHYKRLSAHLDSINIEKTKKARFYVAAGKEVYVRSEIKANPYCKSIVKKAGVYINYSNIRYVKITYGKGDI